MPIEREDLDQLESKLTAEQTRRLDRVWEEIKGSVWKAIDELRGFRTKALMGLLGVVLLGGLAFGGIQMQVRGATTHASDEDKHHSMAESSETAAKVATIETRQGAIVEKVDMALEQQKVTDANVEKIKEDTTELRIEQMKTNGKLDRILDAIER